MSVGGEERVHRIMLSDTLSENSYFIMNGLHIHVYALGSSGTIL